MMSIEQARAIMANPNRNYESERKETGIWKPVKAIDGVHKRMTNRLGQESAVILEIDESEDQWMR